MIALLPPTALKAWTFAALDHVQSYTASVTTVNQNTAVRMHAQVKCEYTCSGKVCNSARPGNRLLTMRTRRYTVTALVCPSLWQRSCGNTQESQGQDKDLQGLQLQSTPSMLVQRLWQTAQTPVPRVAQNRQRTSAWRSIAGLKSTSCRMTVSAPVRLRPWPPARVLSSIANTPLSALLNLQYMLTFHVNRRIMAQ